MVAPGNVNQSGSAQAAAPPKVGAPVTVHSADVEVPPPPGQVVSAKAASTAAPHVTGYQGSSSVSQHSTEVLHQRSKMPICPARLAVGGFAAVMTIGYFVLYANKNPDASAVDVAKVTTGTAQPEDTHRMRK